ncbi:defender against cell death 1 [Globomyces pollinis-pini]|nr:defender against cell death 1 [Globomyces pollinis-pini]
MKTKQSNLLVRLQQSYQQNTPVFIKLIDVFLVFVMLTGVVQFIYMIMAGTYPYNAFLSGFACSVGMFVNTANLRIQLNPANANEVSISPERAFADYAFSCMVLFFFVVCFVG